MWSVCGVVCGVGCVRECGVCACVYVWCVVGV